MTVLSVTATWRSWVWWAALLFCVASHHQASAQFTSFLVEKIWNYSQTNANAPALDTFAPYTFYGVTFLDASRTANSVTLTLPTSAVSNLVENPPQSGIYDTFANSTNLSSFNAAYPAGDYRFTLFFTGSNQQVTVNLPSAFTQPNAPQITNYAAAQSVNAAQEFILRWDPVPGAVASDEMWLYILGTNYSASPLWSSPAPGSPGALNGTSNSVALPAGALQSGSDYIATLAIYRNSVSFGFDYYARSALSTQTRISLKTTATSPVPILTNAVWVSGQFGFDVLTVAGQTVTVVYSTNLGSASAAWPILLTTNSPGSTFRITDPHSATNRLMFYRARNGN